MEGFEISNYEIICLRKTVTDLNSSATSTLDWHGTLAKILKTLDLRFLSWELRIKIPPTQNYPED